MNDVSDFFNYSLRPTPPPWALITPAGPPGMWVYIDDSGDPGMKLDRGSSQHIVMSACVFREPKQLELLTAQSDVCAQRRSHRTEFKYNKTKEKTKKVYFECIQDIEFSVRVIHVNKSLLHSPKLRSDGNALKAYMIKMLLARNYGSIRNAKVFVDGADLGAFGIPDHQYLMGLVNRESPGTIHSVKFADSATNRAVQLADMTAGAFNRHIIGGRENASRDFNTFRHRTWQPNGTVWDFTRRRT